MIVLEFNIFQKKIKKIIGNENITTNIGRIQANNSVMCGFFCIGFINFILKGKSLLDLFSPKKSERNDETILEYVQ